MVLIIPPNPDQTYPDTWKATESVELRPNWQDANDPMVKAVVERGGVVFRVFEGNAVRVPAGCWHAIVNPEACCCILVANITTNDLQTMLRKTTAAWNGGGARFGWGMLSIMQMLGRDKVNDIPNDFFDKEVTKAFNQWKGIKAKRRR